MWAGLVPSELIPGSSLASGAWLAIFGVPWLVEASLQPFAFTRYSPHVYVDVCVFVCVSAFKYPLFIRTSFMLDSGSTLNQYGLILANYICNVCIS